MRPRRLFYQHILNIEKQIIFRKFFNCILYSLETTKFMKQKATLISLSYNITLITLFRYDTEEKRNR